ncbi:anthranilate synthase component II [Oceanibaculum sp.]|uniref:anthranilate synthase component II n=1 Tax=Oceanibaculum sp. TaxID=1903597 RepID=UPI0025885E0C|nr:aminodeoxychorismate/anthranilate synthase component II [Oceanibaculum sp.]MCH2395994.1 aminodeoxychorismate/anthranilate synthase component II [Oceanibaculum sp.]
MYILIDNYDSFTYNLWHFLGDLGAEVQVKRNDQITVDQVMAGGYQGIVISPGPCDPDRAGICLELIERAKGTLPIFGVCLGLQAIGQAFGGKVVRGPVPMHGKVSPIHHRNASVFKGLPSPLTATRYHSLVIEKDSLPDCLEITAETEDGVIMGLAHKTLPIHGVQFHPESIATDHGHAMLKNFLDIAERRNAA